MGETIPGGFYIGTDGQFHNAKGEPVKLTAEDRKFLAELGIEVPSKKEAEKMAEASVDVTL